MPSANMPEQLWVVVGDIHDDASLFARIPELEKAAGILVTGDLTIVGGVKKAEAVMEELRRSGKPVLAQIGNMDRPEVDRWLTEQGINLHARTRELAPGIAVFGAGASTRTPFGTPSEFPESAYEDWLKECWREAKKYPHTVLVSHNPPRGTACDVIPGNAHVGSAVVRVFLEEARPDVCLCGHIHEARAADRVGRTAVVNPGPLAEGGYALLRFDTSGLTAELRTLAL
ncbi:MAG: metallophosphoesterase family protein [Desulfovibrio sp.]|jgi:Icc-related predicted phosphoesterase|nr:metallophosphoesterase family protein [Desulfovibrio sp.]